MQKVIICFFRITNVCNGNIACCIFLRICNSLPVLLGCIVPQIEADQQYFGQKRFNDLELDAQIPAKISSGPCIRYSSITLLYI